MIFLRVLAAVAALSSSEGVERPAAGRAPTAFRIWKPGVNATDHGAHVFTEESARKLAAEQSVRGNLYSIDVDHLSLNPESPPEARKAVGWHKLEVRKTAAGPELWAVDVEWTDAVKAGLEKDPPEWRYFSPAYDVAKKSGEIVAYLNTALTNNPATWEVTALASRASSKERCSLDIKAALAALMGDDEKKKEARAALQKMAEGDGDEATRAKAVMAAFGEEKPAEDKPKPKEEEPAKETAAASEAPPDAKKKEEEQATTATAKTLIRLGDQDRRLAELEAINEKTEREKILATRPDLTKAQLETLADEPLAKLPKLLSLIPPPKVDPAAASRVTATSGRGGEGTEAVRAARLPPEEHVDLVERMGGEATPQTVRWQGNNKIYPQITKEAARQILARRKTSAPPRSPMLPSPGLSALNREGGAR